MDGTTVVTEPPALNVGGKSQVNLYIQKYIALRDKVKEIREAQAKHLAPYNEAMQQIEGVLMQALDTAGVSSMKADTGTVFKSTETSVSVGNWQETFKYIQDNQLWDLFEARVNKTAALVVIQETGLPIPGVKVTQAEVLRVRRS